MEVLERLNGIVWGVPALVMILGVGFYLSVRTGFAQIRLLPRSLKLFCSRLRGCGDADGSVTPFQALCTALAATVGTGNIAGVAGAITIGGPGSIFWMWMIMVWWIYFWVMEIPVKQCGLFRMVILLSRT